jgi:hypothetical protein
MDDKTYEQFFDALSRIVNEDGPYRARAEALISQASEEDLTNLHELISWINE